MPDVFRIHFIADPAPVPALRNGPPLSLGEALSQGLLGNGLRQGLHVPGLPQIRQPGLDAVPDGLPVLVRHGLVAGAGQLPKVRAGQVFSTVQLRLKVCRQPAFRIDLQGLQHQLPGAVCVSLADLLVLHPGLDRHGGPLHGTGGQGAQKPGVGHLAPVHAFVGPQEDVLENRVQDLLSGLLRAFGEHGTAQLPGGPKDSVLHLGQSLGHGVAGDLAAKLADAAQDVLQRRLRHADGQAVGLGAGLVVAVVQGLLIGVSSGGGAHGQGAGHSPRARHGDVGQRGKQDGRRHVGGSGDQVIGYLGHAAAACQILPDHGTGELGVRGRDVVRVRGHGGNGPPGAGNELIHPRLHAEGQFLGRIARHGLVFVQGLAVHQILPDGLQVLPPHLRALGVVVVVQGHFLFREPVIALFGVLVHGPVVQAQGGVVLHIGGVVGVVGPGAEPVPGLGVLGPEAVPVVDVLIQLPVLGPRLGLPVCRFHRERRIVVVRPGVRNRLHAVGILVSFSLPDLSAFLRDLLLHGPDVFLRLLSLSVVVPVEFVVVDLILKVLDLRVRGVDVQAHHLIVMFLLLPPLVVVFLAVKLPVEVLIRLQLFIDLVQIVPDLGSFGRSVGIGGELSHQSLQVSIIAVPVVLSAFFRLPCGIVFVHAVGIGQDLVIAINIGQFPEIVSVSAGVGQAVPAGIVLDAVVVPDQFLDFIPVYGAVFGVSVNDPVVPVSPGRNLVPPLPHILCRIFCKQRFPQGLERFFLAAGVLGIYVILLQ